MFVQNTMLEAPDWNFQELLRGVDDITVFRDLSSFLGLRCEQVRSLNLWIQKSA